MRALISNRKVQVLLNGGLGLGLLAVSYFSVKHFVRGGWPLHHADPILVGAAAVLFLIAYAFKAWGWQRLFHEDERHHYDLEGLWADAERTHVTDAPKPAAASPQPTA